MATRVLLATPYRSGTSPELLARAAELREALVAASAALGYAVDVALYPNDERPAPGDLPYAHYARARNQLIAMSLKKAHKLVLWVDVDLVRYPADLVAQLDRVRGTGIAAPVVYLDQERPGRFYDTGGFIEEPGRHTPIWPPHFRQPGPVVELLSVGCCYLIPAEVYRKGAQYAPAPPYVEHWPVMRFAAEELGLTIRADQRIAVYHAYLPAYGEAWHVGHE